LSETPKPSPSTSLVPLGIVPGSEPGDGAGSLPQGGGEPRTVGCRRPPRGAPFRPGQSGNPQGRPKGARNLSTVVRAALNEKVAVTENGRKKRITKLEAAIKQLVNRAASGEARATDKVIALAEADENRPAEPAVPRRPTRDAVVIAELVRRIRSAP
jgi:Family of unknown function (DUF5681)